MTLHVPWVHLIIFCFLNFCYSLASTPYEFKVKDPHPIVFVQPRHVHLALAEDNKDLSVTWSTINKTDESVVLVYHRGRELKFSGNSVKFVDGGEKKATQWIHKVHVHSLLPNTTYRYRVGSDLGWSDVFNMQTLPAGKSISFFISLYVIFKEITGLQQLLYLVIWEMKMLSVFLIFKERLVKKFMML